MQYADGEAWRSKRTETETEMAHGDVHSGPSTKLHWRERQRDRETERQRDRETERQRDRETERQSMAMFIEGRPLSSTGQRDRDRDRDTTRGTEVLRACTHKWSTSSRPPWSWRHKCTANREYATQLALSILNSAPLSWLGLPGSLDLDAGAFNPKGASSERCTTVVRHGVACVATVCGKTRE